LNTFGCNRALSLFDARQRLVLSYLWELPVPKYDGAKGRLLDDWAVSGITSFQSGFPIVMRSTNDFELENDTSGFEAPGRPVQVAPKQFSNPRSGYYFCGPNVSSCFLQNAPLGSLGGSRVLCCGPGINNFDLSVQKLLSVGEGKHFEFRAEFFNVFNHAQFLNPDGNISDANVDPNTGLVSTQPPGDFGKLKHTRDPREIQFALKFAF
jgi:hypothetical protein